MNNCELGEHAVFFIPVGLCVAKGSACVWGGAPACTTGGFPAQILGQDGEWALAAAEGALSVAAEGDGGTPFLQCSLMLVRTRKAALTLGCHGGPVDAIELLQQVCHIVPNFVSYLNHTGFGNF